MPPALQQQTACWEVDVAAVIASVGERRSPWTASSEKLRAAAISARLGVADDHGTF